MDQILTRCGGLDVHQKNVVACARVAEDGRTRREVATFSSTTTGLLRLSDWLQKRGCTHVAMEATGVYWKPVWHILEGSFELVLANAAHIKNVPGRKTDVKDAQWIADLLAHGLIESSFVPPTEIRELRDLVRTRKQLVREAGRHVQRLHKALEDANIKVGGVISDLRGMTARLVLTAIIQGETDPEHLADLCGRLRSKRSSIVEGLRGRVTAHHRFLLKLHLGQIEAIEASVAEIEGQLGELLRPFQPLVELLITIPGISDVAAATILSEIGTDMSQFPSPAHVVSWAGLCPRSDESAGKRRSTRLRNGAPWLKTVLVQCAWSAIRSNLKEQTSFRAKYLRIRTRRGAKKAIVAIAASLLTTAYAVLRDRVPYHELGFDHHDQRNRDKTIRRLVRRLGTLGVKVDLSAA